MIKICHNKSGWRLLVLLIVFCVVSAITKEQHSEQTKTIIEMNRFFSPNETRVMYNISQVQIGKPLIFLLQQYVDLKKIIRE